MIEGDRYLAMYDSKMTRWRNLPVVFSIWEDSVVHFLRVYLLYFLNVFLSQYFFFIL